MYNNVNTKYVIHILICFISEHTKWLVGSFSVGIYCDSLLIRNQKEGFFFFGGGVKNWRDGFFNLKGCKRSPK